MGTKDNPGQFDCYEKAEPDEPLFTLLARDKRAPVLVELWAELAEMTLRTGDNDEKIAEARECAKAMREWRKVNR